MNKIYVRLDELPNGPSHELGQFDTLDAARAAVTKHNGGALPERQGVASWDVPGFDADEVQLAERYSSGNFAYLLAEIKPRTQ